MSLAKKTIWLPILLAANSLFSSGIDYSFRSTMRHGGEDASGYEFKTALELPFSYSHSSSRLGISDGHYFQLEGRSKSGLHYAKGVHDWSTTLYIAENFSMSPTIANRWLKGNDLVQFESRYLYKIYPWLGAYAHFRLQTSLFSNIDIHEDEKDYDLRDINDRSIERVKAKEQKLTDPFLPLYLQENIGAFAIITETDPFTLESRAAMSFRQTFAKGQKVYVEEKDDLLIIRDLESFYQIGPQIGTSVSGEFFDNMLAYNAGIDAMWPFWQSPDKNRSFGKAIIVEGGGSVGLKLNSWATLNYEYSVKRIPDILEKFQQEHLVNLSLNWDWAYKFGQPKS